MDRCTRWKCLRLLPAVFLTVVVACSGSKENRPVYEKPGYWPERSDTELPEKVLEDTSRRYQGSYDVSKAAAVSKSPAKDAVAGSGRVKSANGTRPVKVAEVYKDRVAIVIGKIAYEKNPPMGEKKEDAGGRVRQLISEEISAAGDDLVLHDAPEEKSADDSPRPDLARKGITFVVKGIASYLEAAGETSIFLRAVHTATGKVKAVVSGRDKNPDEACRKAAKRLVSKLRGV